MELHVVSTGRMTPGSWAETAVRVQEQAAALHIREPFWEEQDLAEALKLFLNKGGIRSKIIVNAKTNGFEVWNGPLHLPEFMINRAPEGIWGASVHSRKTAEAAEAAGASWIMAGPVFAPGSKSGVEGIGVKNLQEMTEGISIPVIAVGGMLPERLQDVAPAVHGAAVVSGIMGAEDPAAAACKYKMAAGRCFKSRKVSGNLWREEE